MEVDFIYFSTIVVTILFVSIAFFQVLLSLGFPIGEFALGGYYKVLPKKLRIVSAVNAMVLVFMSFVFLQHTDVFIGLSFLPTNILVWIMTIFLAINSIANLFSRSKKERFIMTHCLYFMLIYCFIKLRGKSFDSRRKKRSFHERIC